MAGGDSVSDKECWKCKIEFNGENILGCEGNCGGWFHLNCASVTENQYELIKSCEGIRWYCSSCYPESEVRVIIKDRYAEVFDEIKVIKELILNNAPNLHNSKIVHGQQGKSSSETERELETIVIQAKHGNKEAVEIENAIKKEIMPENLGIGVTKFKTIMKEKAVAITCENKEDKERLKNAVEEKLGSQLNIQVPIRYNPVLKIVDMHEQVSEQYLIDCLVMQNRQLGLDKETIKVRKVYKVKQNYAALIEVDNLTAERIVEQGKLKIGWLICRVFRHSNVYRCFKCYGFNHKAEVCKNKPVCWLCGEERHEVETKEWRLLGQEQDETLMFSWVQTDVNSSPCSHIGLYSYEKNTLEMIYSFDKIVPIIQASINSNRNLFGFVTKENVKMQDQDDSFIYKPYIIQLNTGEEPKLCDLEIHRSKQIMVQFLYRKQSILTEKQPDKFLVLIHQECVVQYQLKSKMLEADNFTTESLVRVFLWAQWDPVHQTLYYIHYRKPTRALVEDEEEPKTNYETKLSPTLSGLQFHDDLPHETVMNIPLNLPHLPSISGSCGIYEDDTVPLRIHNCSLDLMVLTDSEGIVCICHHYLYQPVQPAVNLEENDATPVHFAYSVTVLHQSCVIHCVIPGIPWNRAKTIRPIFILYGDHHILVFIPGICTHLLDIGTLHEPTCHITTTAELPGLEPQQISLAPLLKLGESIVLNLMTLDVVDLTVSTNQLVQTFKSDTTLENKLSILHYFLVHRGEVDIVIELLTSQIEKLISLGLPQLLKEFLIGSSYATAQRNLPSDAGQLVNLLPVTTQPTGCDIEVKVKDKVICLSQDVLWNASMMLLSPQQRLVPYRVDIWTKLWDHLVKIAKGKQKFKPTQVVEKLLVSLVCYQPEALSRSSTPMSPGGSLGSNTAINDLAAMTSQCSRKSQIDALPFYEIESCTASKQEHIISVNLRELSMHLLKQSAENKISRFQWQSQTPMHVHAVATRYVAAQLEQSRFLCHVLCKAVAFDPRYEQEKGFVFIDQLSEEKRHILFTILERYYLAVESIAFPLPQGFTSFFTFLGYRTLRFNIFLQYVHRNVFELQVDVMKIIMMDIDDTKTGIQRKLKLLTLLPRSRAKRLLSQWSHPVSLMIRAREHSLNILSGVEGANPRAHGLQRNRSYQLGLAAFPSEDRLSPLDTFLDLLTAKASLTELDFGLLIEATITSTDDFL